MRIFTKEQKERNNRKRRKKMKDVKFCPECNKNKIWITSQKCRNCYYLSKLGKRHNWGHKISAKLKGKPKSEEHRLKVINFITGRPRLDMKGKNHPNWKGGKTKLREKIRKSIQYKQWRTSVFTRDEYVCIWCKSKKDIEADHIISFAEIIEKLKFEQGVNDLYRKAMQYLLLWDINNGRTLCKECHKKTNNYPEGFKMV